ncbi:MAG: RNA 2',3'-cyclic phosphodiesterase [Elusimicrobia bacterium]|nr:RNA 2',3'-cyclic phosphodiesterase [Elusimicrobiota bacterium]
MTGPAAGVLARAVDALRACAADAKWSDDRTFHVTAAFLGETLPERLDALRAALRAAHRDAPPPAEAAFESLGAFPSLESPRVLWAGVGRGAGDMRSAQRALLRRLGEASFPVPDGPFLPHTTLGRLRSPRGREALLRAAEPWRSASAWAGADFPCGPLRIVASRLTPAGPVHTELP